MGEHFNALDREQQLAVEWKAKQNLNLTLASGNSMAMENKDKFIENNRESLAANNEGMRHVLQEYKENLSTILDDD